MNKTQFEHVVYFTGRCIEVQSVIKESETLRRKVKELKSKLTELEECNK